MASQAWKNLERLVAQVLKGERVCRGADFAKKEVDVKVHDFPNLQIDAKYRKQNWRHHAFLDEIRFKYCDDDVDIPVLVTKNHNQVGAVVSLSLHDFGVLLDTIRDLRKRE